MFRNVFLATVLLLTGLLTAGNYYCYDLPAALNVPLRKWLDTEYNLYQTQINLLYSVYSLPNIILPLIGGVLIDKIGSNAMIVLFSSLVCVGQAIFAYGVERKHFIIMLIGRLVFGLGAESLDVGQAEITTKWFKGKGLAFALGANLSFARIATGLNDNISPYLALKYSLLTPFLTGLGIAITGLLSGLFLTQIHRIAPLETEYKPIESEIQDSGFDEDDQTGELIFENQDSSSESIENAVHFAQEEEVLSIDETFKLSQQKWYHDDAEMAGFGKCSLIVVMSIPDFISAVGSPICGLVVDYYGKRSQLMIISGVLLCTSLILMGFTELTPMIGMSLIGLAYSLFAATIWPCVPYLVESDQIATAYGLLATALNLALFGFPLIIAFVRSLSHTEDFTPTLIFLISLGVIATLCSLVMYYYERNEEDAASPARSIVSFVSSVGSISYHLRSADSDMTVKVMGDGIVIAVPTTKHKHQSPVADSPDL
ncbi:hypothetical protein HK103_005521 [Boothiomyces macroporosus]|uniref:Lysosomal dipeptide transporter MFSD1 n=1 Tax=Boothiomyces macroporosus TaxID=261099 RepID=A0AAD5UJD3_9FUNG|nr:hypothetical protein HK103_005521 [Boothiomyces macroporosus]